MITPQDLATFTDYINNHSHFLILGPKNTDGDTIGTNVALAMYLEEQLGKKAVLYAPNPIDEKYKWMPWVDRFVTNFNPHEPDAIFTSDTAVPHLFAHSPEEELLLSRGLPWVNLDHHISNSKYGTHNFLYFQSTSCSMILYNFLKALGATITPDMATHMLMSIYMDSGSYIHPNTTAETYEISAELVAAGADQLEVATRFFRTSSVSKLKLWGKVLDRMQLSNDGVLTSAVTENDLIETGADREDLEGLVDFMNAAPNKICVLLSEDGKGNVKGSLRTQATDVDVNVVAQRFGGGGHRLASGFTLKNKTLQPVVSWKVLDREMVS